MVSNSHFRSFNVISGSQALKPSPISYKVELRSAIPFSYLKISHVAKSAS